MHEVRVDRRHEGYSNAVWGNTMAPIANEDGRVSLHGMISYLNKLENGALSMN